MPAGRQKKRLVLCGICFKANCPLSKWITENEDDGDLLGFYDELQQKMDLAIHAEIEAFEASQLTREQVQERITETVAEVKAEYNVDVDISNLDELLNRAYVPQGQKEKEEETAKPRYEDHGFLKKILESYSDIYLDKRNDNEKKEEH